MPPESQPDNLPEDPFGGYTVMSTSLHELFKSLQESGFTEMQALRLTSWLVTDSQKDNPDFPREI